MQSRVEQFIDDIALFQADDFFNRAYLFREFEVLSLKNALVTDVNEDLCTRFRSLSMSMNESLENLKLIKSQGNKLQHLTVVGALLLTTKPMDNEYLK